MSKQIAVRLPDDLAAFVDAEVASGRASSRAGVLTRALERERQHQQALSDIAILKKDLSADDLDDLAAYAARAPLDDLD
ncbi:type II toxin-antitoxin system ParD family antitoxin [Nesterenkonia ebinurensis]|uniref:type II toxin-antitoxin system ParD family antitoxin n=1 Tax=Nesterenkonia ebinurensis TaxID=2608252 RepID=UPI00123DB292|nr:type II toxin-antitoxin system ParD family antitoxin [Nesterenkonia ebinurensis]